MKIPYIPISIGFDLSTSFYCFDLNHPMFSVLMLLIEGYSLKDAYSIIDYTSIIVSDLYFDI